MDLGEWFTRGTARVAVMLYLLALSLRLLADGRRNWQASARWSWTVGGIAYLLHVICAFQYYHDWSHAAAYTATARQTAAVVGWDWGGGLYANYVFTVVWLADILSWWRSRDRYATQPRGRAFLVQ